MGSARPTGKPRRDRSRAERGRGVASTVPGGAGPGPPPAGGWFLWMTLPWVTHSSPDHVMV